MKEKDLDPTSLTKIVDSFKNARVAVIGDIIVDKYISSLAKRVSREAPVLILKYEGEEIRLGGAGNAIANVRSIGAKVIPFGFVGDDYEGKSIVNLLKSLGIETNGVITVSGRKSTIKTRILAGSHHTAKQQVLRIDIEPEETIKDSYYAQLIDIIEKKRNEYDAIIISDYGYYTLSETVINFILSELRDKIICADSRYNLLSYKNVTACTPNEPETAEALRLRKITDENIKEAGRKLLQITGNKAVLITRGKKGMALFTSHGEERFIDIFGTDQVADVTGAGDTVIAVFTTALAVGASFYEAAKLANYGGGIVVTKMGTATVSPKELKEAIKIDFSRGENKDI